MPATQLSAESGFVSVLAISQQLVSSGEPCLVMSCQALQAAPVEEQAAQQVDSDLDSGSSGLNCLSVSEPWARMQRFCVGHGHLGGVSGFTSGKTPEPPDACSLSPVQLRNCE